jgi:hypothetical protein
MNMQTIVLRKTINLHEQILLYTDFLKPTFYKTHTSFIQTRRILQIYDF